MEYPIKPSMEYLMKFNKEHIPTFCDNSSFLQFLSNDSTHAIEVLEYITEIEDASSTEFTYLLLVDSVPVGLLKITCSDGAASAAMHHVQIRRPFRGRGHGKRLLIGALLSFFDHHTCDLLLHVSGRNQIACHLYQEIGFTIIESLALDSLQEVQSDQ